MGCCFCFEYVHSRGVLIFVGTSRLLLFIDTLKISSLSEKKVIEFPARSSAIEDVRKSVLVMLKEASTPIPRIE